MKQLTKILAIASLLLATGTIRILDMPNANATEPFSVVVIPDTQYYGKFPNNFDWPAYNPVMKWIKKKEHSDDFKIEFVIHVGDITNDNEGIQWDIASNAHEELGGIPYSVVQGNHDYHQKKRKNRVTGKDDYYNTSRYSLFNGFYDNIFGQYHETFNPDRFREYSWYPEENWPYGKNDNNATLFESGDDKFMVLSLEFAPRKDALCWADNLLQREEYKDRMVIVVTHCYQRGGKDIDPNNLDEVPPYELTTSCSNTLLGSSGEDLWKEFVSRHSNIFMVLSGHKVDSEFNDEHTGIGGNTVYEILTDLAGETGLGLDLDLQPLPHGRGWFRIIKFYPDEKRFSFRLRNKWSSDYYKWPNLGANLNPLSPLYTPKLQGNGGRYPKDPKAYPHRYGFVEDGDPALLYKKDSEVFEHFPPENYGFSGRNVIPAGEGSGNQLKPAASMRADGRFVVAWEDENAGNIKIRSFEKGGCPCTPVGIKPTTLSTPLPDGTSVINATNAVSKNGSNPSIGMSENDKVVVVWQGEDDKIYANILQYNKKINQYNKEIEILEKIKLPGDIEYITIYEGYGNQLNPDVVVQSDGSFVVVWEDHTGTVDGYYNILAAAFNEEGKAIWDKPIEVDTDVMELAGITELKSSETAQKRKSSVVLFPDYKSFVVAWQYNEDNRYRIKAEIFLPESDVNRRPLFIVNGPNSGNQLNPNIAADSEGNLVVVWQQAVTNEKYDIYWEKYYINSDVNKIKDNYTVTGIEIPDGHQINPDVGMFSNGSFVVTWQGEAGESPYMEESYEIYKTRYDSNGDEKDKNVKDVEFDYQRVNEITWKEQKFPVVAANQDGYYAITWQHQSPSPKGISFDIVTKGFEPLVITCPADIVVPNDPSVCGANVTYTNPTVSNDTDVTIDFSIVTIEGSEYQGTIIPGQEITDYFDVGDTELTFKAENSETGETDACSFSVQVEDTEAPEIMLSQEKENLWPPNHKYFSLNIADYVASVTDNCPLLYGGEVIIDKVSSDEELNSSSDGNTENDIIISSGCNTVNLASERKGKGNGRLYNVTLVTEDDALNSGFAEIKVEVPHDKRRRSEVVDDGPVYVEYGCEFAPLEGD